MMKDWPVERIETEKRRYAILRHLSETPGYELGDELLMLGCRAQGVPSTLDQVRTAMGWLEEQDLVALNRVGEVVIARLRNDGLEVVNGYRRIAGILPPRPGA